jgi:hypothetical protein
LMEMELAKPVRHVSHGPALFGAYAGNCNDDAVDG